MNQTTLPPPDARRGRRPTGGGLIPGAALAATLDVMIPVVAGLLIALSVLGTYYGARGLPVPLFQPGRVWADIMAAPGGLLVALIAQVGLSVAQWGSRQKARLDVRWWALYAATLGLSAWWNWTAYGPPLTALGVPLLVAAGLVLAGDVAPEVALVRD